jgi:hypothetical protein
VSSQRRISLAFGVLFLITFITSIPALALYQPVLDNPQGYIAGGGEDNRIYFGVLLELILIVANIATAVVLFPIVKWQNEILSVQARRYASVASRSRRSKTAGQSARSHGRGSLRASQRQRAAV